MAALASGIGAVFGGRRVRGGQYDDGAAAAPAGVPGCGPAVDLKLFAMQAGMFGRAFAVRFAPSTFVVAIVSAYAVGLLVLGGGS